MRRFYCPSKDIRDGCAFIRDSREAHHIKNVLRLKPDDAVIVFSDNGCEYLGKIFQINPENIIVKIKAAKKPSLNMQNIRLTIACAIPKKAKIDEIVDKLIQLGVARIIPLITERTIVRWDAKIKSRHLERWQKIALSASKQSQRNVLPVIEPVENIDTLLSRPLDFDLKLIPTLEGERKALREVISAGSPQSVLVLIGPEGDFTPGEVRSAKKAGFIPVSLGDLVLRVDTAAIAVASFLMLYRDEDG